MRGFDCRQSIRAVRERREIAPGWMKLCRWSALDPVFGSSGTVSNGKDPNDLGVDHVCDVIGEYLQIHATIAVRTHVGQLRMILDPNGRCLHFLPEADAQAGFDTIRNGRWRLQILPSHRQESAESCWIKFLELGEDLGKSTGFGSAV